MNFETSARMLGNLLKARNFTFAAAESCTGGLLLSTMTDVSGSSAYVLGGVVTYSNDAKQKLANVQTSTLVQYGAVSEETAREMASGVRDLFGSDVGVSITGIAGPSGGTPEKPVGLVYIGVAISDMVHVGRYIWAGNRVENKQQSVAQAIQLVGDVLSGEKG